MHRQHPRKSSEEIIIDKGNRHEVWGWQEKIQKIKETKDYKYNKYLEKYTFQFFSTECAKNTKH